MMIPRQRLPVSFFAWSCMIAMAAATERIPPDRLIHPVMTSSSPELLPESRREPEYPEALKKARLSAELVLQTVINERGKVTEVSPVRTTVWKRTSCSDAPGDLKDPKEASVRKASRQFEDSAVAAVKHWKYRPATMQGVPTTVFRHEIVRFDPCSPETPQ
jgi:hypothetical protein